jgi:hypothetical protein
MTPAEAVARLPWLSPCAASLTALGRPGILDAWSAVRADPGCVLLVARTSAAANLSAWSDVRPLLEGPAVLEEALHFLADNTDAAGFVDWSQPELQPIWCASLNYAHLAQALAERSGRCPPAAAWTAGLLAPLGCLAAAAVNPAQAAACLTHPDLPREPEQVQERLWGLDQAALARRLGRLWRLPPWLAATIGHLALPADTAANLGADPELVRLVQQAVFLVDRRGSGLYLSLPPPSAASRALPTEDVGHNFVPELPCPWAPPHTVPLLSDLLRLAADHRRRGDLPQRVPDTRSTTRWP